MTALIVMRILVKAENVVDLLDDHRFKWVIVDRTLLDDGMEIFTIPERMGYYEAVTFYEDMKDMVEDVWYKILDGAYFKVGRNEPKNEPYVWTSCKKQLKEEE